jgi:hypothetical protein
LDANWQAGVETKGISREGYWKHGLWGSGTRNSPAANLQPNGFGLTQEVCLSLPNEGPVKPCLRARLLLNLENSPLFFLHGAG